VRREEGLVSWIGIWGSSLENRFEFCDAKPVLTSLVIMSELRAMVRVDIYREIVRNRGRLLTGSFSGYSF